MWNVSWLHITINMSYMLMVLGLHENSCECQLAPDQTAPVCLQFEEKVQQLWLALMQVVWICCRKLPKGGKSEQTQSMFATTTVKCRSSGAHRQKHYILPGRRPSLNSWHAKNGDQDGIVYRSFTFQSVLWLIYAVTQADTKNVGTTPSPHAIPGCAPWDDPAVW